MFETYGKVENGQCKVTRPNWTKLRRVLAKVCGRAPSQFWPRCLPPSANPNSLPPFPSSVPPFADEIPRRLTKTQCKGIIQIPRDWSKYQNQPPNVEGVVAALRADFGISQQCFCFGRNKRAREGRKATSKTARGHTLGVYQSRIYFNIKFDNTSNVPRGRSLRRFASSPNIFRGARPF